MPSFSIWNDGQALFGFRHAALLIAGKVRAVTGVSAVEPNAPFVAFVEHAVAQLFKLERAKPATVVPMEAFSASVREDWQSLSASQVFWLPLLDHQGEVFGGLWLARDNPWSPSEQVLLAQLGDTYSHAWLALQPRRPWRLRLTRKRQVLLVVLALASLRQSVLAPAEVVPLAGRVVAAPLDGVVAEFLVKPNQTVKSGDLLVRFESTTLKAQADVAQRALGVAEAELKANSQRAFADAESSSKLDLLAARVEQKRAERDYAAELLKRSEVRAERDGIAVASMPVSASRRHRVSACAAPRKSLVSAPRWPCTCCADRWPGCVRVLVCNEPAQPACGPATHARLGGPGRFATLDPGRPGAWALLQAGGPGHPPAATLVAGRSGTGAAGGEPGAWLAPGRTRAGADAGLPAQP